MEEARRCVLGGNESSLAWENWLWNAVTLPRHWNMPRPQQSDFRKHREKIIFIALMRLRQQLAARMGDTETALEWAEKASEGVQQTSGMYTGILPLVYCGIGVAFAQARARLLRLKRAFEQAIECRRKSKGDHWARALLMAGEFYLERDNMTKSSSSISKWQNRRLEKWKCPIFWRKHRCY